VPKKSPNGRAPEGPSTPIAKGPPRTKYNTPCHDAVPTSDLNKNGPSSDS